MAVNIGPKIGIDGEKEYRKQINDLITQQKTFSAEMRELESSFDDNTSAMEKNRKKGELLEKQIANQEKQVEELEKGLKASEEKYGENATETQKWKQAVANAKTELNKMKKELDKVPRSMKQVGEAMQSAGKKMQSVGSGMTKYVTAPLAAIGAASIAAFNEVDEGMDIIVKKTGATGEALESLQTSAKNIATTIPTSFETAGEAIGVVSTKFGLVGEDLEDLSGKFIKFANLNDEDVSTAIEGTQKVMAAFGVDTKDAGKLLDVLNATGQQTGIDMNTLRNSMVKNAASLQQMGMDAYSAAGFLGQVETSGAEVNTVMAGMQKALVNAEKSGKTLPEALSEFQGIMNSTASDQEKLNAAMELFGNKAGPAIYEACKQGSLSFESLSTDAEKYLGNVETTFENTLDAPDQMQIALNKVKVAGSEIGKTLLQIATPAIESLGEAAQKAGEWFSSLDDDQQRTAANIAIAFAAGGPALVAIGKFVETVGTAVTKVGELASSASSLSAFAAGGGYVLAAAAAVGVVAGAITLYEKAVKDNNETLQDVIDRTEDATGDLDEAINQLKGDSEAAQKAIDTINAQEDIANGLIGRLEELEKQSSRTADEQLEMEGIVKQLNTMYPDLKLSIDKATGSLSKSTTEIKNYVKNASKMALLNAYMKAAEDGYTDLAEASVALKKAQDAEKANLKDLEKLEKAVTEARAKDQEEAAKLGDTTGAMGYAENQARIALEAARKEHGKLSEAVEEAQGVYETAKGSIEDYQKAADDLSAEMADLEESQEDTAEAVENVTDTFDEAEGATRDYSKAVIDAAKSMIDSAKTISDEYDKTYQAARDSIEGQIGLFDEWQQETEVTAADLLKNLQSQITGMTNYNANMKKLTDAAVKSNDPNFKAFVKSVSEMGIGAAGEVQALVDAMENDKDTFNEIVGDFDTMGGLKDEFAANTAYISNDFQTKGQAMTKSWVDGFKKVGTSVTTNIGKNMVSTIKKAVDDSKKQNKSLSSSADIEAKSMSRSVGLAYLQMGTAAKNEVAKAVFNTQRDINGMNLEPKVSKIDVPKSTTTAAKDVVQQRLNNVTGRLEKINGAETSAKTAKHSAETVLVGIGATMQITNATDAAQKAKNAIQNIFNNNPIISWIKTKTEGSVVHNAAGGIIRNETLSWLAEGNRAEAVIPLEANRSRAIGLYQQAGQILGVTPTVTIGSPQQQSSRMNVAIDTDALYAAVAAGAAKGMESANVRIYWNNREAGRIMRDMGVQFA